MGNKCKIIQDLLPTYIESMTSNETTTFIEEHLKNCQECNKIHIDMKESIKSEEIENTETIRKIKKYKKRIKLIQLVFLFAILAIPVSIFANIIFKFYVIKNAYIRNTNYNDLKNFTVEYYDESIERFDKHYTTYYKNGIMKKYYGNDPIEFYDGENHYLFDNKNMTYSVKKENVNTTLNINISTLDGMENIIKENGKISNFEILKFILFQDDLEIIANSDFRSKPYYLVTCNKERIYLDNDTFFAERFIEKENKESPEKAYEYRVTTGNVSYRETQLPDLSKYTLIEN